MADRATLVCCLIAIVGCTASPRQRLLDVEVGMSMEQVSDILGDPARNSHQRPYEAWLYEYKYFAHSGCGSDILDFCDETCLHAVVWFNRDEVVAVTGVRSHRVQFCGIGVMPINWNDLPESVRQGND